MGPLSQWPNHPSQLLFIISNAKHFEKSFEQLWSGRVLSNVRSFWFCVGRDSGNKFTTIGVGCSYMERICIYPKWTWMVSNDSALRSWHVLWLQISGWSKLWNAKLISGQLKPKSLIFYRVSRKREIIKYELHLLSYLFLYGPKFIKQ